MTHCGPSQPYSLCDSVILQTVCILLCLHPCFISCFTFGEHHGHFPAWQSDGRDQQQGGFNQKCRCDKIPEAGRALSGAEPTVGRMQAMLQSFPNPLHFPACQVVYLSSTGHQAGTCSGVYLCADIWTPTGLEGQCPDCF